MASARRKILHTVGIVALLGVLLGGAWTAYIWHIYWNDSGLTKPVKDEAFRESRTVAVTPLRDGLYMLQGDGGNITALVGGEGILIVDSDEDWMAPKIDAALKTLSDQPVRYVINTHFHGDHRGGNGYFRRQGAEVIAHVKTLENMKADTYAPAKPEDLPTITFEDEYRLSFAGEDILIRHLPNAHTNSDVFIYFQQANVLAAGDVFSYGSFPFISTGTHGTIDAHLSGQQELLALVDKQTLIVPGHGALTDKAGLAETNGRLGDIRGNVAWLKKMGVSRSAARAFYPTYPWRADWRNAYVTDKFFLALVYNTLPDQQPEE
jgi:glyoxylase-like metal-dependent hydrolase (beta-lactamase superfamily II)